MQDPRQEVNNYAVGVGVSIFVLIVLGSTSYLVSKLHVFKSLELVAERAECCRIPEQWRLRTHQQEQDVKIWLQSIRVARYVRRRRVQ